MSKYAIFDAAGLPQGFYAEDIHGPLSLPVYGPVPAATEENPHPAAPVVGQEPNPRIPAGVVEITDDQWAELITNPGTRKWENGQVVPFAPPPAPAPPRQQIGSWILAALADLGWLALFDAAAAYQAAPAPGGAGKALDAKRYNATGKSDFVLITDSKWVRIAGRAATLGAAATPPIAGITLGAVFDRADQLAAGPT